MTQLHIVSVSPQDMKYVWEHWGNDNSLLTGALPDIFLAEIETTGK